MTSFRRTNKLVNKRKREGLVLYAGYLRPYRTEQVPTLGSRTVYTMGALGTYLLTETCQRLSFRDDSGTKYLCL